MVFFSEIKEQFKALKPSQRDLRKLGLTFLVVLGIISGIMFYKGNPLAVWLLGAALLFGAWGLLWPAGLRPVYIAWMTLALVMGYFMSRLILIILFYLVVTPIGLIMRLLGKDLLDKKFKDRDSYWHRRAKEPYDPVASEKMY